MSDSSREEAMATVKQAERAPEVTEAIEAALAAK